MRVLRHNGHVVKFYDSPEDMTMRRYQRFSKFVMIDAGVGSDFNDFNLRSQKVIKLLKQDLKKEALIEFNNRFQMVYNAFEEYSPKHRALAILVHSIDDKVYANNDYGADTLDEIIDKLEEIGVTQKQAKETVDEVKKKLKKN